MNNSWPPLRLVAAATILLACVGGCAISAESQPHDISEDDQGVFGNAQTGDEAAGDSLIYLLAPERTDAQQQLRSVQRDVQGSAADVLTSLLAGPNDEELDSLLGTAIPDDTTIHSVRQIGPTLVVDINDALIGLTQDGLRLAVAQLVLTSDELPEVDSVEILVDGEVQAWPVGDGEVTSRPLTKFDYPGFAESTQPEFPPVPDVGDM